MKKIFLFLLFLFININLLFAGGGVSSSVKLKQTPTTNSLDDITTGIVYFPSAYNRDVKKTGLNFDFTLTNIVGEIMGSRFNSSNKEYTNPILMSLVSITGKWIFLKENKFKPNMSIGTKYTFALDLGNKINSDDLFFQDIERATSAYGFFVNAGKTIINPNSRLTIGLMNSSYSKIFTNLVPYYFNKDANIIYGGTDLNFKKFGMFFEILKPLDDFQNPIIYNLRIKKFLPTVVISYVNTDFGSSWSAVINFRVPLYPPFTEDEIKKSTQKKERKKKYKQWQKKIEKLNLN